MLISSFQPHFTRVPTWCFLAIFCLGFQTQAAADPATILISNGEQAINTLTIGDDLYVGLDNVTPNQFYDIYLRDEGNVTVAVTTVRADPTGFADPVLLWLRSGVRGCGPDAITDFIHRFPRFEDAETVMDGRSFSIEAVDSDLGIPQASTLLPMVDANKMRLYFANCNQCPIYERIENQALYVGAANLEPEVEELRVFVVDGSNWSTTLTDVRPAYGPSQVIPVGNSGAPLHALVWLDPTHLSELRIVVRASTDGPTNPVTTLMSTDQYSEVDLAQVYFCSERIYDEGDADECSSC